VGARRTTDDIDDASVIDPLEKREERTVYCSTSSWMRTHRLSSGSLKVNIGGAKSRRSTSWFTVAPALVSIACAASASSVPSRTPIGRPPLAVSRAMLTSEPGRTTRVRADVRIPPAVVAAEPLALVQDLRTSMPRPFSRLPAATAMMHWIASYEPSKGRSNDVAWSNTRAL
jgi:hypothetical protein